MIPNGTPEKTVAPNVEALDDPYEKQRETEQMQLMRRLPKAALASIMSNWVYFGYCAKAILDAQTEGLSGAALQVAWLSFAVQLGQTVPEGIQHLLPLSAWGKAARQPLLRLTGGQGPSVDVFITYCGEGFDVLMDTVRAAIALDYPKDRYRVVVLDDSVSDKIKEEIDIISSQTPNLYYTTRGIRPKTHTKAGNLNHGLEYVSTLPGGASELVAVLDVDMIPSPHWLRALIPHLLSEAKIAMASSPQRFYNIPDGDPLDQVWAILFDVLEPLKNATNSAWCCGSGFIVRRAALDGIGGVPEESLQEDILTSFYLTAAGWRIVYVHEDMQWGLVPATIGSYVKQQKRLLIGVISLIAVLWSPRARNMTIGEKFGALFPAFSFTATVIINMVSLVAMPILLVSGAPLVQYSSPSQLRIILSLLFVKFIVALSYDILCTRAANYQFKLLNGSSTWAVPHQFMAIVRSTISAFTGAGLPSFSPSGLAETKNSSSSRNTISLKTRDVIVPHVLIIASLASGLAVSVVNAAPKAADISQSIPIMFTNFLVRAGWPTIFLIWSKYITDAWTPISYAAHLAEEPWPIRKDLLDRDPVTGVAYPNQQAKDQVRVRPSQRLAVVRIVYCVGVCAAAAWSL